MNLASFLSINNCPLDNLNWGKVFQNGPRKICGRQPLKKFTWSILEYFVSIMISYKSLVGFSLVTFVLLGVVNFCFPPLMATFIIFHLSVLSSPKFCIIWFFYNFFCILFVVVISRFVCSVFVFSVGLFNVVYVLFPYFFNAFVVSHWYIYSFFYKFW